MKAIGDIQLEIYNGKNPREIKNLTILDSDISEKMKIYCRCQTLCSDGRLYTTVNYNNELLYVVYNSYN